MTILFYAAALVSIVTGVLVITRRNAMHAVVYLILLLLSIALMLYTLGAAFVAALQVIIYAGAIVVLFVFAVMMLNLGEAQEIRERQWLSGWFWVPALILTGVLGGLTIYALASPGPTIQGAPVSPKEVGRSLYQTYLLGVELASVLLLAGLVSAFHFGVFHRGGEKEQDGDRPD